MDEEMEDVASNASNSRDSWTCLPYELQHKILQTLAHDQLKSSWLAEYSVVCRSWQREIEMVSFEKLVIKYADISELDKIVVGARRTYLKHVLLSVELETYSNRLRMTPEDEEEQAANNAKFTTALVALFEVLERWDTPNFWKERNGRGINLELQAFSPSDKRNLFGTAGMDHEGRSRFFDSLLDFDLLAIEDPQGIHGLPMVNVVTGVHMLRRHYRNIAAAAWTPILCSLPRLEEVRLEPWQQPDELAQQDVDCELAGQIPFWPTHLRRLSLFTHFGAFDLVDMPELADEEFPRPLTYRFLAQGLRRLSLTLEELSVSYMADAAHFFEPFLKIPRHSKQLAGAELQWPNLRWLSMTSGAISQFSDAHDMNDLLRGVGLAAQHMPQLEALELWNAKPRHGAGVFRYLVVNNTGVISWTSTFEFKMSRVVKTAWRQVARQHTRQEPLVFNEVELSDVSGGPEGFIHAHLATRQLVLHDLSSEEMMKDRSYPPPVLKLRNTIPKEV